MPTDREMNAAVREIYRTMPGAPMPQQDEDGFYLWGEIEGNEHWQFCATIVNVMRREMAEKIAMAIASHDHSIV